MPMYITITIITDTTTIIATIDDQNPASHAT
jgi:hypothetical protein